MDQDIRLYQYATGTLRKVGSGKTGKRPHFFSSVDACEKHADFLKKLYKDDAQYLIIEYFGVYNSKIIKFI